MLPKDSHLSAVLSVGATALLLASCTPGAMRKSADNEVHRILVAKTKAVPNAGKGLLDITPPAPISLAELKKNRKSAEFLGNRASVEKNARVIPLSEALGMAVTHNRAYRDQKESLYLQALDLTLVRHEFAPIFSVTGGVVAEKSQAPVTTTVQVPNPAYAKAAAAASAAGTATTVPQFLQKQVTTLVTDNTLAANGTASFDLLMRTGGRLAVDFTTDFLRFLTGNLTRTGDSVLAANLTQPLLRGAGYRATMETLTQAERDLMYAVRNFTQYRKTFAVDITSRYYRTLEARDIARNAHLAYKAFESILEGQTALAKNDRIKLSQLDQIQQAALKYKRIWVNSVRTYEQGLDDLKIALGVPVDAPVILDEKELGKLELLDPGLSLGQATQVALVTRLDLDNTRNSVEDTARKIKNAAQDLLPQLDLTGTFQAVSNPNNPNPNIDFNRRRLSGGVNLDPRLDKKADRNAYRAALIHRQKAERDLDLAEETVKSDIRADWRDLDVARKNYDIAQTGVALSERRLEYENTLRELGQGTARDLIDAQQDLIDARDALTSALISHTLARLKLWKDMGVLFIRKDGSWMRVMNRAELAADE